MIMWSYEMTKCRQIPSETQLTCDVVGLKQILIQYFWVCWLNSKTPAFIQASEEQLNVLNHMLINNIN